MRFEFVFGLVLTAAGLPAQQAPLSGVIEGYTFDAPTRSVRPVLGSLGSAIMGQPAFGGLAFGSVSPRQNFALVFDGGHCELLSGLGTSRTKMEQIPGAFAVPDGVAWSGDGSTAVLFSRTGNWIQSISGLPSSINAGESVRVAPPAASLSAVATNMNGARVIVAVTGQGAGVYGFDGSGNFLSQLAMTDPIALAVSEDGKTVYALDGASKQLYAQSLNDLSYQSWPLADITDPVAIRPAHDSTNRSLVYVAGRSDQVLQAYDASTHQVIASAPLSFRPNSIDPLGNGSYLLQSRATSDDVLQAFRNAPQPLVYFVPATPVRSQETHRK